MPGCYRREELRFSEPLFKEIPVTYLLTMEGSTRRAQYMKELREYRPTAHVVVLHNSGHRTCKKPDWVRNTISDIWHANLHIFDRGGPVIILEDDVRFVPCIRTLAASIEKFVLYSGKVDVYLLGGQSFVNRPSLGPHIRSRFSGDAHAAIYTEKGVERVRQIPHNNLGHDSRLALWARLYISRHPCALQKSGAHRKFKAMVASWHKIVLRMAVW